MSLPQKVRIVEVGPRDGLQNEKTVIPLAAKIALIDDLASAGLEAIEAGSFVNPQWVPQMADSEQVFAGISKRKSASYRALVPNIKGFERALAAGADEIAIFAAASEAFSKKNTNCSIAESLQRFEPVMRAAQDNGIRVRGYVSCVLGCPIAGHITPDAVVPVVSDMLQLGCYEISLGDTIGTGTAGSMHRLLDSLLAHFDTQQLAVHCHDTYGQALSNILVALERGVATVDSSVAGLGGCPYAEGATGNVATEDVVYLLQGSNIECGVDLTRLVAAGEKISATLGRQNASRAAIALGATATAH